MPVSTADLDAVQRHPVVPGAEQPVLVYRDDSTGERVELTAGGLGGWAAKAAGLLQSGCGLRPGDRARPDADQVPVRVHVRDDPGFRIWWYRSCSSSPGVVPSLSASRVRACRYVVSARAVRPASPAL
jgi:hypothetical protein